VWFFFFFFLFSLRVLGLGSGLEGWEDSAVNLDLLCQVYQQTKLLGYVFIFPCS